MTPSDHISLILAIIVIAIIAVLLLADTILSLREFNKELTYLNCEIKRTRGSEQKRFKKRRRKLWLSLLPFVKY